MDTVPGHCTWTLYLYLYLYLHPYFYRHLYNEPACVSKRASVHTPVLVPEPVPVYLRRLIALTVTAGGLRVGRGGHGVGRERAGAALDTDQWEGSFLYQAAF